MNYAVNSDNLISGSGIKKRGLTGGAIKIIAVVSMLIDHIGAAVIELGILNTMSAAMLDSPTGRGWAYMDMAMRKIGRIAFPLFAFLLVEGFLHTRDVKKYGLRLLLFALLSEIPFDLAFQGEWFSLRSQNIYFTLFFGLASLYFWEKCQDSEWKRYLAVLVCCALAQVMRTDYGAFGVLFIVILYTLCDAPGEQTLWGSLMLAWELPAPIAFIPIRLYNGERGIGLTYVFYAFYPAHLMILYLARMLIIV